MFHFLSLCVLLFIIATANSQADSEQQPVIGPDVTVGEYKTFLKAVASESDPHGLYSSTMALQIIPSTQENAFDYVLADGAVAEQMMVGCDLMQERRYCNWIEHGAPKNQAEAAVSTETGAYDLTGSEVIINRGATHHLYDETGITFCVATTRTDTASPLMFGYRGSAEEKEERKPSSSAAALRRQSESDPSQIQMRHNPLFEGDSTGPIDQTSQPKTPSLPRPPENILGQEKSGSPESRPRSWEEKSLLDHYAYFDRIARQGMQAMGKRLPGQRPEMKD